MTFLIISQILNGLGLGMLYALVGVGLTLILGVLNIPNFAHGVLYALGAYFAYTIAKITGSFYFAMFLSPLLVVLVGFILESQGDRSLYHAHHE